MKIIIDKEDEHLVSGSKINYSSRYPTIWKDGKNIRIHTLVIGSAPHNKEVDHINRNKLDNRKKNLRFITHAENLRNRNSWSESGLKGAYFDQHRKPRPWKSEIRFNGKKIHIGYFETADQAHQAYIFKLSSIDV